MAGALQALPRRLRLPKSDPHGASLRVRRLLLFDEPLLFTFVRLLHWFLAIGRFRWAMLRDRLAGKVSPRQRGVRMRQMFEQMGGTAIKVGQQMAVRVDFLPFEVCDELGKLMDAVPPFSTAAARKIVAQAAGGDLDAVYAEFEDEPIGSASVACVWRARLHDGRRVAVKVRRPGVHHQFTADLRILGWLTQTAELFTLVRPDFFKYLISELRDMLLDELDFGKEANFQAMFRRYVKRDKLKWVSAPRLFMRISNDQVLVTEFIEAYACQDVLRAVETQDEEALAQLASLDISPRTLGRQLMELSLWSRLECPFFHSDPHPGNILILPGSKLVMLDFGACGIASSNIGEDYAEMIRRLLQDDISGATSVALSSLAPLPRINTAELRRRIDQANWNYTVVIRSKDGEWWERTTAALWMRLIEATKEFQMPVNLDVLRLTRASLLYDTLACRLDPSTSLEDSFKRWGKKARKRARRRDRKRITRAGTRGTAASLSKAGDIVENVQKGLFWVNSLSRDLPREFLAASNKGAFVMSSLLRLSVGATLLGCLVGAAVAVFLWLRGSRTTLLPSFELAKDIATHPVSVVLLMLVLVGVFRRVQTRLEDKEPGA